MTIPPSTRTTCLFSPLGMLRLAATDQGLCGVWFDGQRHPPDPSGWEPDDQDPLLTLACAQLNAYFAGQRTTFTLPLDLRAGSPFQQTVWQALLTLPFGQTCSYGELSARLGRPSAVRAVSQAIGRNPLSIVVPCHRVLGARGALTGYAGGLERKLALLRLEGAR